VTLRLSLIGHWHALGRHKLPEFREFSRHLLASAVLSEESSGSFRRDSFELC
jgi:hypothetical protein